MKSYHTGMVLVPMMPTIRTGNECGRGCGSGGGGSGGGGSGGGGSGGIEARWERELVQCRVV